MEKLRQFKILARKFRLKKERCGGRVKQQECLSCVVNKPDSVTSVLPEAKAKSPDYRETQGRKPKSFDSSHTV